MVSLRPARLSVDWSLEDNGKSCRNQKGVKSLKVLAQPQTGSRPLEGNL